MTERPTDGTRMFFLEDGAVLFSEPRQELHVLNTMAAVIWCHLEDGMDRVAIARELVASQRVPVADATRYVDQALETWKLQGLLRGRSGPVHPPPDYVRAAPADTPEYGTPVFTTERMYSLLGIAFRVRCTAASDDLLMSPMLPHLQSTQTPVISFDVVRHGERVAIYRDSQPLDFCRATEELVPALHSLIWLEIADLHGFFLQLHAGALAGGALGADGCMLLPARPGSGKTTLTAALVRAGWNYLSDEIALLDAQTMRVAPMPIALCIKRAGLEPVVEFWPEARSLVFHLRSDGKRVGYLVPPVAQVMAADTRSAVRAIVFPRYRAGHDMQWSTLSRTEALRRIVDECVAISGRLDNARVGALVNWIAAIPCHALTYGSTASAVAAIRDAFGETAAPARTELGLS